VHRDVAGDVVENVGLGEVVEAVGRADGDSSRKLAALQAIEEEESGDVAADGLRLEAGERLQSEVDVREPGYAIVREIEDVYAVQKMIVGVGSQRGCMRVNRRCQDSWFCSEYWS